MIKITKIFIKKTKCKTKINFASFIEFSDYIVHMLQ